MLSLTSARLAEAPEAPGIRARCSHNSRPVLIPLPWRGVENSKDFRRGGLPTASA